jgi:ATP:corrinoid adenosyltransferase
MKPKKNNSKDKNRIKELEKQLKETQKALRESELKNKLLDEMIAAANR